MAYQPTRNYDSRSPILHGEPRRPPWMSDNQTRHHHNASVSSSTPTNVFDPESEDSDVSNPDNDIASAFSLPINLPPAPSKQALENPATISAHLRELERVEDHNVRKHSRLKEKRKRKDERIARKRALQDERIKAIMDARARRDSRINLRREREDIAFTRFYETLEEEETRLRQRLKRLKRGLPLDDSTPVGRSVSVNSTPSMSSGGPAYSTVPPPAKRHQASHPSQTEYGLQARAQDTTPYAPPPSSQPSYQFYPSSHQHPSPSGHYHPGSAYPPAASPPILQVSRGDHTRQDLPSYAPNGQRGSPHLSTAPPQSSTPNIVPSRHPSTSYDTRPPPPPMSSGFATVNQPSSSAFAAVNSRSTETPPAAAPAVSTTIHAPEQRPTFAEQTPSRGPPSEDKSSTGGNGSSKRTPSTTHPYQMSEAFANRHHHCERTDSLNRGIWTWYGHNGTQDNPTTTPTEMYLKCNHENCGRIDWRTVHGLQCHIVKNHEQPKGTIGSLEKALERYGVPVSHIEEIEKREGLGAGGTMADPKNTKIKSRMRDSGDRRDFVRRDHSANLQRSHPSHESDSPTVTPMSKLGHSATVQHRGERGPAEGTVHTPLNADKLSTIRPTNSFTTINSSWQGVNSTPVRPLGMSDHEPKIVQAQLPKDNTPITQRPPSSSAQAPFWPSWQAPTENHKVIPQASPMTTPSAHQQPILYEPTVVNHEKPSAQPGNHIGKEETRPAKILVGGDTNADQKIDSAEKKESSTTTISEIGKPALQISEVAQNAQDTPMTGVSDSNDVEKTNAEPAAAVEQESEPPTTKEPAQEAAVADTTLNEPVDSSAKNVDGTVPTDEPPQKADHVTAPADNTEEEPKAVLKPPEPAHKRVVPSRRESRRSSTATAAANRVNTERVKEEDNETISTANTASKADSVDDDSDSITVAPKPVVDRQKERDRGKEAPRRHPNGRFVRKEKR